MKPIMRKLSTTSRTAHSRGFLLVELIVALVLLGAVTTIVVPTLGWMGVENRRSLQRQEAAQGLNNLLDQFTTRPYKEITQDAANDIELPEALTRQLPGAELKIAVNETEPGIKRIRVELAWNQRNGNPLAPMRVSAWVHEKEARQ